MKFFLCLLLFLTFHSNAKVQQTIGSNHFIEHKISDNLYVLKAHKYHTNIGVYIGKEYILLIDPMAGNNNHQNLLNRVNELSGKPIKYVLNTHSHIDHSGANSFFADLGATIISQQNSVHASARHDVTFLQSHELDLGDETLRFYHISAHSHDDTLISFTNKNVIFTGDVYMTNSLPNFYFGGGAKPQFDMLNTALSLGNENTQYVAGHGNASSGWNELKSYTENTFHWVERIKMLAKSHLNSDEIAKDPQINQLSRIFNKNQNPPHQRLKQTIERILSSELVTPFNISSESLKAFAGDYQLEDGSIQKVLVIEDRLKVLSDGFLFDLIPLSENTFQLRGHYPRHNIIFAQDKKQLMYFDGKVSQPAIKKP